MKLKTKTNRQILADLAQLQKDIKSMEQEVIKIAKETHTETIELLTEQSDITKASPFVRQGNEHGLSDKIELEIHRTPNGIRTIIGVPAGEPTTIAIVQEQGAAIAVTPKMRGYVAHTWGIYLKASTTHIHVPGKQFWSKAMTRGADRMKEVSERKLRLK
jgi:flagellin-like hook-associated protein FlgL